MKNLINNQLKEIDPLCRQHKVKQLFVFGSVLTDQFNENSDIDLIVSFDKEEIDDYFDNYFDFKYSLENIFKRKVDLLEEQTIKNPYLKQNIDETKTLIYG
ncbi:nucleotidyltransferase domain-containing protein [Parabacteroides sp. PF5-6]|uniref:nucleotidyltransferase family protein n=1 Tax=Parabacteroides sp. PF5-6 TaxID=1742403 RepID=UPI0024067518|nr:nucleotidyltransferase domain-containing protein [Parabacteroides sp. PF5-6]MDF9828943.1 putative nucleotidyltransferase [Parabacteroides sp. PF5-6]